MKRENIVSKKLEKTTNTVPDDGGPEVTNMHLLGDVRRGEIHHNSFLPCRGRREDSLLQDRHQRFLHKAAADENVDKDEYIVKL